METQETIYVIDDDPSIRGALGSLFRSVGMWCIGYSAGSDFLNAFSPRMEGCLVLDVRLPGMNGLDLQVEMSRLGIRLPVVLMTGHGDIPMSVRGMKAGAVDFLPKPFRDQDMLDAVTHALAVNRERWRDEKKLSDLRSRFAGLSDRQRQVTELITDGKMNKEVAYALGLSEVTVKAYRGQAMRKMGARSLAHLVKDIALISPVAE